MPERYKELLDKINKLEKLNLKYKQMLEAYRLERDYLLCICKEYSDKLKKEWFDK